MLSLFSLPATSGPITSGPVASGLLLFAALLVMPNATLADEATMPSLKAQLEAKAADSAKRFPAEMRSKFAQGVADVDALGLEKSALQVGDAAPDHELTDIDGNQVTLSSLWAEQPIVVTFYRGGWCPYCNLQLKAMQSSLDELSGAGAKMVAVSPELAEYGQQTRDANELEFTVLTDLHNELAQKFGIVFRLPDAILPIYKNRLKLGERNGDEQYSLPLAATYLIDTEGKIRYAFLNADYKKRAEPAEVIEAVKSL